MKNLLFYFFSSLPGLAVSFGLGNVPSRYLAFFLLINLRKINKKDLWLLGLLYIVTLYPLLALPFRPFHLLDINYVLSIIYLILGISVIRNNPLLFKRFVKYFWVINIIYTVFQTLVINITGDFSVALILQNVHSTSYVIPEVVYIPYLYRVTGLFVESAPFVIYLMFTHFAFVVMGFGKVWIRINLTIIFLSGAKLGLFFLLILFLLKIPVFKKINFFYILIAMLALIVTISPIVFTFIADNPELALGSLYVRLGGFISTISAFISSWESFFMGNGYVSSTEIMSGKELVFVRGIDFFSTFIVSNGIVGTFLMLLPLYIWVQKNINFSVRLNNLFLATLFLALLTMGSLINFQYAYMIFILVYFSQISIITKVVK